MDKKKKIITISVVAILVIALIIGVILISGKKLTPEEEAKLAVEKYITELGNRNVEEIIKVLDGKGIYAWNEFNENAEEFVKQYKNIKSEYTESYENILKVAYIEKVESSKAIYTKYTAKASNVKEPEKIEEGLYKITLTLDETFEQATGDKFVNKNEKTFYVYNGKIVSISDENPLDIYNAKVAIEKYVNAINEEGVAELLNVVDLRGQVAYAKNSSNIQEEYEAVSEKEIINAEKSWNNLIKNTVKGFEEYRIELSGYVEVGNDGMPEDFIYAKVPVKITYVEKQEKKESTEEKVQEGSIFVYLYNGKLIGVEKY